MEFFAKNIQDNSRERRGGVEEQHKYSYREEALCEQAYLDR